MDSQLENPTHIFYTPRGMVCWLEPTHPFTRDLGNREVQVAITPSSSDDPMPSKCKLKLVRSSDHMCEALFFFYIYIYIWDNYSKPTWGLARFHFTYPWFKTLHFAHLNFNPLPIRYPPFPLPLEKHIF